MKRSTLTALAPLLLACTLSGCQAWEEILDKSPVTQKAILAGAVVGGTPVIVGCAPVTLPIALNADGREGMFYLFAPGIPTAIAGGVTLGLPTLILESLVRLPGRVWRRARGESCEPPQVYEEPREEEVDPAQEEPPYHDWPNPRHVPD